MPTTLPPVLATAPFVEPRTGVLTRTAFGWLQSSYLRQGGEEAATNTELAGGVLANAGHISQVEDDLGTTSGDLAALEAEVTALQEAVLELSQSLEVVTGRVTTLEGQVTALEGRVDTLETTVSDHETRLDALEAWRAAVVAGLPAVVSVAGLPTLTDAPATADALRDNLTSAWETPLETNDAALATTVNAVRNALAA
jgi:septal ring factor EnvC (AmiA/AmiB activator)